MPGLTIDELMEVANRARVEKDSYTMSHRELRAVVEAVAAVVRGREMAFLTAARLECESSARRAAEIERQAKELRHRAEEGAHIFAKAEGRPTP